MKVLVIDDDPDVKETLQDTLKEAGGWTVLGRGFTDAEDALRSWRPDLVVLDLVEDSVVDAPDSGNAAFERIWEIWFCPVVVYSAFPDQQDFNHPLVAQVEKGRGSEERVRAHLEGFELQAKMIATVHDEFDKRIREALRDSIPLLSEQFTAAGPEAGTLARSVRRLVAARVDEGALGEGPLHAWERFVVPPLGDHLLTADLLKLTRTESSDAASFRLVLTPSCDLVAHGGAEPRATRVLVARCESLRELDIFSSGAASNQSTNQSRVPTERQKRKLRTFLNDGAVDRHVFIPALQGRSPAMVANLKRLELLCWNQIVQSGCVAIEETGCPQYERVASTDSPFREMVTWFYLQVAGRPGLPPFDARASLNEIVDSLQATGMGS
ncbi:MAG: hypothetical protein OXH70_10200 [Acidobacteria bacterium]|nr:hypothetical protein [Acidobacteriota bacterium]